jgi:hypothetical protein
MNSSHSPEVEDDPGLEGPDYVALVIEWNDDDTVTNVSARPLGPSTWRASSDRSAMLARNIATVLGALGAIALTTWGLRRLRAAS